MSTNNAYGKEKVPAGKSEPAKGKLGVMIPGMGAVATTLIAGVEAVRKDSPSPLDHFRKWER
jgi:myo-inositol-1-phosphate synthase